MKLTLTLWQSLVLVSLTFALLRLVGITRDVVAPRHRHLLWICVKVVDTAELAMAITGVVADRVSVRLELILTGTVLGGFVDVLGFVHKKVVYTVGGLIDHLDSIVEVVSLVVELKTALGVDRVRWWLGR